MSGPQLQHAVGISVLPSSRQVGQVPAAGEWCMALPSSAPICTLQSSQCEGWGEGSRWSRCIAPVPAWEVQQVGLCSALARLGVPWVTVTPSGFIPQSPPRAQRWSAGHNTLENLLVLPNRWHESGPAVGNRPHSAQELFCLWPGDGDQEGTKCDGPVGGDLSIVEPCREIFC